MTIAVPGNLQTSKQWI